VKQIFDAIVDAYDQWYDTAEGMVIFDAEVKCLRSLHEKCPGHWLEVGVGTGRFASALGIAKGIDPALRMLVVAARRGILTCEGSAENLPFPDHCFDGVLMALTLCFVANSQEALRECRRVLHPRGRFLLGTVPADSPWGREYSEKASKGHPVYARARFLTVAGIVELAQNTGFELTDAASTLLWKPGQAPQTEPRIETGIVSGAGFLGLLFRKTTSEGINRERSLRSNPGSGQGYDGVTRKRGR